ncbi:MAG: disulfide reductase [Peptococcaceae bacterium]|nr:disulfide reductase [Peptococcaceae bacterium]
MRYSYYPGCSLHGAAIDYQISVDAVCSELGIKLDEVEDWNCCGATAAASEDQKMALLLTARNIAKCSGAGQDLAVSCNACYLRLDQLGKKMEKYPKVAEEIVRAVNLPDFEEKVKEIKVKHILEIFYQDYGLTEIAAKVKKPLKDLKVVPYYGCQLVRPKGFDQTEMPTSLDELLVSLGAQVLPFYRKSKCCGAALIATNEPVALAMIKDILNEASNVGAEAIVVTCPLCEINLDAYQDLVNKKYKTDFKIPIVYFTQLMGLAFGIEKKKLGFERGIVSRNKLLPDYV